MALLNKMAGEIHCKIVYYGPGMGGKTSNLQFIYAKESDSNKSELLSIATETERTLFFDFRPSDPDIVRGYRVCFHMYTVPGSVLYKGAKTKVLQGVDGIVFVADSRPALLEENYKS